MKFAQTYKAALERDEYPPEWIESAISYKKLKKCIKRVQQELLSLGLDRETLNALWQHVGAASGPGPEHLERMLSYRFDMIDQTAFVPRLTVAIDPRDGSPMDAWLSPETRRVLRRLAQSSKGNSCTKFVVADTDSHPTQNYSRSSASHPIEIPLDRRISTNTVKSDTDSGSESPLNKDELDHLETVEIPLTSDSEFFQILRRELRDLDRLQEQEQRQIQSEITELGQNLRLVKAIQSKRSNSEIQAWRRVFELYADAQPFLSSHEYDAGVRKAADAETHLQQFTRALTEQSVNGLRLGQDARAALDRFLHINIHLLRLMKFQEINQIALTKIMKKFDKRTALHAQQSMIAQTLINGPFLSKNLAQAMCFTISEEILNIIPSLDDYLCPVCFSITYKPIRLRCNHVFCIRCMVVMQRAEKAECPLCRKEVVMDATSGMFDCDSSHFWADAVPFHHVLGQQTTDIMSLPDNIDKDLMKFLKQNFKDEVRQKQEANEVAAGVDRWGEGFEKTHRCAVM